MMKTLVIHPKDQSTDFLSEIYIGKDWTIISKINSKSDLKKQIKSHDRIIMLGHGTEDGLLNLVDGFKVQSIIDSTYVYLLRNKICVCIWCNADQFVEKYGLKGLHSGMIISEVMEGYYYSIPTTTEAIETSNKLFAKAIKKHIDSEMNESIIFKIKEDYNIEDNVVKFNRENIFYIS